MTIDREQELRRHLRLAAEACGEPLTIPDYRRVSPEMGLAAYDTIVSILGPWAEACASAGVKANPPRGKRPTSYTKRDCVAAVAACWVDLGARPSISTYGRWQRAGRNSRRLPSVATIRIMVGWREALRDASDLLDVRPKVVL